MTEKPNIILIMTDDQGPWALGCAGTPELRTPVLDQMAKEGMRFNNFYCTSPVCSAARASILTGYDVLMGETDVWGADIAIAGMGDFETIRDDLNIWGYASFNLTIDEKGWQKDDVEYRQPNAHMAIGHCYQLETRQGAVRWERMAPCPAPCLFLWGREPQLCTQ